MPTTCSPIIRDHYNSLVSAIGKYGKAAIAFSGGVDSSLVAKAAFDALGNKAVAVTVCSEFTAKRDLEFASISARGIGIKHEIIKLNLLSVPDIVHNNSMRCYHCKSLIIRAIDSEILMEGSHAEDPPERPGLKAVREAGVISPLAIAGFNKQMIVAAATMLNLSAALRPSNSCLATRINTGTPLTLENLKLVEAVENIMYQHGALWCRARPAGHSFHIEYGANAPISESLIGGQLEAGIGHGWNFKFLYK